MSITEYTSFTANTPFVRVPVLSNTTVSSLASFSMKLLPLTRIPFFEAQPIPAKKPSGIDTTNAQGQETTRNISPRYIQVLKSPRNRGGTNITINASATTIGV